MPRDAVEILPVMLTVLVLMLANSLSIKMLGNPVETSPAQVMLDLMPLDGQSVAKLFKLKSMTRQNKKHWGKLNSFLIREFLINKF